MVHKNTHKVNQDQINVRIPQHSLKNQQYGKCWIVFKGLIVAVKFLKKIEHDF